MKMIILAVALLVLGIIVWDGYPLAQNAGARQTYLSQDGKKICEPKLFFDKCRANPGRQKHRPHYRPKAKPQFFLKQS